MKEVLSISFPEPQEKTFSVPILTIGNWDWPGTLKELLERIDEAREAAPEKYRDDIRVECNQDEFSGKVKFYYLRPENKEEKARRLKIKQEQKTRVENAERKQYARLKKKFDKEGTTL